nr:MAG TPA: hypothetical protein [Caudoviricetes sp.]
MNVRIADIGRIIQAHATDVEHRRNSSVLSHRLLWCIYENNHIVS